MDNKNDTDKSNFFTINVYFGKKDLDIIIWVKSIPKGLFSYLIREALRSGLRSDTNYGFPQFPIKNKRTTPVTKTLSIPKEDSEIINYLKSLDENMISHNIKQVIRKSLLNGNGGQGIAPYRTNILNDDINLKSQQVQPDIIQLDSLTKEEDIKKMIFGNAVNRSRKK
ncbi:MAG: hypothetical protein K0R54_32 [Clostridiaceae bacterium]|jgi:hypothetical protein|nr:hypothetical protein [Clostridiaceae bacterium]